MRTAIRPSPLALTQETFFIPNDVVARWHMMLPPRDSESDRATGRNRGLRNPMDIKIEDRGRSVLREKLRERLERAAALRCDEHNSPVVAVSIHGRENGWFDTQWTTCCESLQKKASAIVKDRC